MAIRKRKTSRFTLIELLVVIVVIGIVLTVVAPRASGVLEGRALDASTRRLALAGVHAGNLAATTGMVHGLHVDLREGLFFIVPEDRYVQDDPRARAGTIHRLPPDVRFTAAALEEEHAQDVVFIRFAPDGWADNAVIHLEDARGRRRTVAFTMSMGRLQTSDHGGP